MENQDMNLVLSTDAKPRLKWTPQLHQRFVEAVNQLGGTEKATPKSLMRVMGITGLTLYHLKSHLQKYRLGTSPQSETNDQLNLEEMQRKDAHSNGDNSDGSQSPNMNESMKISKALQMQLEVQRKLQEQIEVQRHLQLRIEAQGKYLQSVLRKAQETIAGYGCYSQMLDQAKAELSQLASMVSSGYQSSSLSELTDSTELNFKGIEREELRVVPRMCSLESSLTSSHILESQNCNNRVGQKRKKKLETTSISGEDCKRCTNYKDKSDEDQEDFRMIDLNDAQFDECDSDGAIGLNGNGLESQLIEYL